MKANKFSGVVNAFICDILDPIIEGMEIFEDFCAFARKYLHEHPDVKIDDVDFEFKLSHSLTIDPLKKSSSDLKTYVESIMKKMQSGEDEILFRKKYPQPEENYLEVDELEHN